MTDLLPHELDMAAVALDERAARLLKDAKRVTDVSAAVLEREAQTSDAIASTFRRAAKDKRDAQRAAIKEAVAKPEAAKPAPPIPGGPLAA